MNDRRPVLLEGSLVEALTRLAQVDVSVRAPRTYTRDEGDTLAFFVNLIAEEVGCAFAERDRRIAEQDAARRCLERRMAELSETLLRIAAGKFDARAERTERRDAIDVLAHMVNNTASEVGALFEQVERERKRLQTVLEAMVDGVVLLGADGEIQDVNPAFTQLLGFTREELLGKAFFELIQDLGAMDTRFEALLGDGTIRHLDLLLMTKSGQPVSLMINGGVVGDANAFSGIVLVARDERELQTVRAQLQIADRMAAIGTVAAGVAHEINNPLAAVFGNLEYVDSLLEEGGTIDQAEVRAALADAREGTKRVRDIVRELKMFSRGEDSTSAIDVNMVMESTLALLKNELRHRAEVIRSYGSVRLVRGDEGRLGQVFMNLVHNAVQAIPEGRAHENEIRIATWMDGGGRVVIEVSDTGDGIAADVLPRIFEAFYTTKPMGVGTGLGLSICEKVVTSMKGTIEARSKIGKGTTFRVVLPGIEGAAFDGPTSGVRTEAKRRASVLVVDDEESILTLVKRVLGREHDLVTVQSGTLALAALERTPFDVVLCDIMMPNMSGPELFGEVRRRFPTVAERFVFLTGGAFSDEARRFLASTPNARLEKPFTATDIRTAVANAVR